MDIGEGDLPPEMQESVSDPRIQKIQKNDHVGDSGERLEDRNSSNQTNGPRIEKSAPKNDKRQTQNQQQEVVPTQNGEVAPMASTNAWSSDRLRNNFTTEATDDPVDMAKYLWINDKPNDAVWSNPNLVEGSTKTFNNHRITETQVAQALHERGLWQSTAALAVTNGGKKIEVEMKTRRMAIALLMEPLNINGQSIQMQEAVGDLIHVSLFNIPLGYPIQDIKDSLVSYGVLHSVKQQFHKILGRLVPVGTRIAKFYKIDTPIPKNIFIAGRSVYTVYSGQDEALTRLRHERNTTIKGRPDVTPEEQVEMITYKSTVLPSEAAVESESDLNMETDSCDDEMQKKRKEEKKRKRTRRKKNKISSNDEATSRKNKKMQRLLDPEEVVNLITTEAATDWEEMDKLITYHYGEERDPSVVAAEVLMAKYGRKASADKSFPAKTQETLGNKAYDDPAFLQTNMALNYVAYMEIHSDYKYWII